MHAHGVPQAGSPMAAPVVLAKDDVIEIQSSILNHLVIPQSGEPAQVSTGRRRATYALPDRTLDSGAETLKTE